MIRTQTNMCANTVALMALLNRFLTSEHIADGSIQPQSRDSGTNRHSGNLFTLSAEAAAKRIRVNDHLFFCLAEGFADDISIEEGVLRGATHFKSATLKRQHNNSLRL